MGGDVLVKRPANYCRGRSASLLGDRFDPGPLALTEGDRQSLGPC